MTNKPHGHKQPRDNETGQFGSKEDAKRHPKDFNIEIVPNPGYGDTGRGGRKK